MALELAQLTNISAENEEKEAQDKLAEGLIFDEFAKDDSKNKQTIVKEGCIQRCMSKICKQDPNKKPLGFENNPNLRIKANIKRIVNGRFVLTLMTFVTLFALIGVSKIESQFAANREKKMT